jgi:hypothetical protein
MSGWVKGWMDEENKKHLPLFTHASIYLFIYPSTHLLIYPSTHLPIHSSTILVPMPRYHAISPYLRWRDTSDERQGFRVGEIALLAT